MRASKILRRGHENISIWLGWGTNYFLILNLASAEDAIFLTTLQFKILLEKTSTQRAALS